MKTIVPDYYSAFACKMGACRHSCCIGWEIDIDQDKLDDYRNQGGEIGARLQSSIALSESGAHFRLTEDERCPFLNSEGLCDLILELGEDCLCQICADHPRFRNFFSDREELGLGLCCEAAAQLILRRVAPVTFLTLEDDGEQEETDAFEQDLLQLRAELIADVQNRRLSLDARRGLLEEKLQLTCPIRFDRDWADFFLGLERLDEAWTDLLTGLRDRSPAPLSGEEWELPFEQLLVYLLYRHLPGALDDDDVSGRIAFALLIADLLAQLCAQNANADIDALAEFARMYSSEIEYSDENIGAILECLHARYPEL